MSSFLTLEVVLGIDRGLNPHAFLLSFIIILLYEKPNRESPEASL
jgi:hypothetical protein